MVEEKYICDICSENIPYKNTMTSIELRVQTDGNWHRYPLKYDHVCMDCQDRIARFTVGEIFEKSESKPTGFSLEDIKNAWNKLYREDLKTEYSAFYNHFKRLEKKNGNKGK